MKSSDSAGSGRKLALVHRRRQRASKVQKSPLGGGQRGEKGWHIRGEDIMPAGPIASLRTGCRGENRSHQPKNPRPRMSCDTAGTKPRLGDFRSLHRNEDGDMQLGKTIALAGALVAGAATGTLAQSTSSGQPGAATATGSSAGATGGSKSSGQPVTHHKALKHRPRAAHTKKSSY